jgi:hypothetical protein
MTENAALLEGALYAGDVCYQNKRLQQPLGSCMKAKQCCRQLGSV